MAKTVSAEELQLRRRARRRLIGAIALVTIVAVFLPMVLDHEPKRAKQDISIQIPSPDSGTFTSKIVPLVGGAPAAKSAVKPVPETSVQAQPPSKAAPAAGKTADTSPTGQDTEAAPASKAAQAKPAPAKTAPAPATDGKNGFVVQVAALNDAGKAQQMREQIAAAGIKSYTEVVPTAKGSVTRVRAGPFPSRDEAEKVRDKLKDLGLNGNLVPK